MKRKYELTPEYFREDRHMLYRIRALISLPGVKIGALGGFVESEDNLSHEGNCWIDFNGKVFGNAKVYDNARVCGSNRLIKNIWTLDNGSKVYGDAQIYENATVVDNAKVSGHARVFGHANVGENALVFGSANISGYAYIYDNARVFGDAYISPDYITFIRDVKIRRGVWTQLVDMGDNRDLYLLSHTLEKLPVSVI